jgi:hypothetical protein
MRGVNVSVATSGRPHGDRQEAQLEIQDDRGASGKLSLVLRRRRFQGRQGKGWPRALARGRADVRSASRDRRLRAAQYVQNRILATENVFSCRRSAWPEGWQCNRSDVRHRALALAALAHATRRQPAPPGSTSRGPFFQRQARAGAPVDINAATGRSRCSARLHTAFPSPGLSSTPASDRLARLGLGTDRGTIDSGESCARADTLWTDLRG